jgi:hypothetical protein
VRTVTPSTAVAKKKQATDGVVPQYFATTAYKQWARRRWEEKGWSLIELARQIKRINPAANATSGGLSQFFGPKGETPQPSNTTLMPELNKLLGAPPPPVCDPAAPFSQIRDRLEHRWSRLTAREQRILLDLLGDSDAD